MSTDYFHCRESFLALPGVREVSNGQYRFALAPGPTQDYLAEHFAEVDAMIRDGNRAKASVTSSAAVCAIPGGEKIFVKRNGVSSLKFVVRYFFLPARVFRAALAAVRVEEAGVPTPRVFAVGEKRRAHFLLAGYLITEAMDACDLMSYVIDRPDAPAGMPAVIREAARVAAALHNHGFYHGDLKLVNLYRTADDAPCGVWDLDSAQLFAPGEIPHEFLVRELGRIVSSVLIFAERNSAFPDDFFDLGRVTRDLLDAYAAGTAAPVPAPSEVMDIARVRWLNKRKLRFDYGGLQA